ncbi:MAG: hypothetical protein Q9186_007213 [Xanthomendoza sp. 1 TL-2023]
MDENYYLMDDNISPTSSRTSTPILEETNMHQSPLSMDSVTELSYRLEQHTLEARRQQQQASTSFEPPPTLSPPSWDEIDPPPTSSSLRTRRRRSSSLLVWQQRQTMTRRQCTTAHLSHISALVEEMSHNDDTNNNNPYFDLAHPSSGGDRSPISPTSNPGLSFTNFYSTPSSSSSGSEDCSPENSDWAPSSRIQLASNKVGKEWRRGAATMNGLGREHQKLVWKKIRMRKSLGRLKTGV